MSFLERSQSYGGEDIKDRRQRKSSRSNSIFASAWSLLVGNEEDKEYADGVGAPYESARLTQKEAWLQASYTAIALLFLFITGCIFVAVYYILEPFLQPLLWGILVGMVLHPFKHAATSEVENWFCYLDTNGIPLSVGLLLFPLFTFNWLTQCLETIFFLHWKLFVGMLVCIVTLVLVFHLDLPVYIYNMVQDLLVFVDNIHFLMVHTSWLQVCSLCLGFILLLLMSSSSHKTALKTLSLCLWFLFLLNLGTYLCGPLAIPVICLMFTSTIIASLVATVKEERNKFLPVVKNEEKLLEQGLSVETLQKLSSQESDANISLIGTEGQPDSVDHDVDSQESDTDKLCNRKQVSFNHSATVRITSQDCLDSPEPTYPHLSRSRVQNTEIARPKKDGLLRKNKRQNKEHIQSPSNQIFLYLLTACVLILVWKHPVMCILLAPFAMWSILKYFITFAVVQNSVLSKLYNQSSQIMRDWFLSQDKLLFPWPMPKMYAMYLLVDKKLMDGMRRSIGRLASALIIILLLFVVLAVAVLLVFQIQIEVLHYASAAASVWNYTVVTSPQLKEWMGAESNETLRTTLENFANENYAYVREKLSDWIHTLVADSTVDTEAMEQHMLDLFDKLYSLYVVQNTSASLPNDNIIAKNSVPSDVDGIVGSFSKLLPLIDVGTTVTVLTSVWSILFDNMAVALSFLYSLLQLLFSGGTLLINSIVFLTALFYLLSYSEQDYLPVKWVMDFFPLIPNEPNGTPIEDDTAKKKYGRSFSRTIRSVFHATLRRAFFYGFYTWLIHTLFGLPVSILPAVLAGIAGAIPFIGAYWVALPAVLELWLLQGHLLTALGLLTLSLLPLFFVDTLINREIEGGHPYLTGLAIAGGIYFAGLQGALIGPILLSCLLFVVEFYDASFF